MKKEGERSREGHKGNKVEPRQPRGEKSARMVFPYCSRDREEEKEKKNVKAKMAGRGILVKARQREEGRGSKAEIRGGEYHK